MRAICAAAAATLFLQFSPVAAEAATLVANISLGRQTMTVSENGFVKYRWKVSTARKGYVTPTGSWSGSGPSITTSAPTRPSGRSRG